MAITKCPISAQTVNRFTGAARALRQRGRTSDWMVRAGLMEKIMSKSNRHFEQSPRSTITVRSLDSELDAVTGGFYAVEHVAIGPRDDGKLPTLPCDFLNIICRILS